MAGRVPAIRPPPLKRRWPGYARIGVKIVNKRRVVSTTSWPALCRPSTILLHSAPQVVDSRDKPGHDTMGTAVPPTCYFNAYGNTPGHDDRERYFAFR